MPNICLHARNHAQSINNSMLQTPFRDLRPALSESFSRHNRVFLGHSCLSVHSRAFQSICLAWVFNVFDVSDVVDHVKSGCLFESGFLLEKFCFLSRSFPLQGSSTGFA